MNNSVSVIPSQKILETVWLAEARFEIAKHIKLHEMGPHD